MKFGTPFNRVRDIYTNRYDPEGARAFGRLYWHSLLVIVFLILVASMVYGEWDLYEVLRDLGSVTSASSPSPSLNRTSLKTTIFGFDQRQRAYETLRTHSGVQITDPSR